MLVGKYLLFPIAVYALTRGIFLQPLPMIVQIALTLLIVIPMGPFVYRLAYEPIAEATPNASTKEPIPGAETPATCCRKGLM